MSTFRVLRQLEAVPTGETFTGIDSINGRPFTGRWHRARFEEVGSVSAATPEAALHIARDICNAPILEEVR